MARRVGVDRVDALAGVEVDHELAVALELTGAGIRAEYPDEAERRKKLGKFYYQPPSGESWADVVLRVRSLLADLRHGFEDRRVWLFSHQAVIMTFRYVLEGLTEQELLELLDTGLTNRRIAQRLFISEASVKKASPTMNTRRRPRRSRRRPVPGSWPTNAWSASSSSRPRRSPGSVRAVRSWLRPRQRWS